MKCSEFSSCCFPYFTFYILCLYIVKYVSIFHSYPLIKNECKLTTFSSIFILFIRVYDRWSGPEGNHYQQMKFSRGASCWNGPSRSAEVFSQDINWFKYFGQKLISRLRCCNSVINFVCILRWGVGSIYQRGKCVVKWKAYWKIKFSVCLITKSMNC